MDEQLRQILIKNQTDNIFSCFSKCAKHKAELIKIIRETLDSKDKLQKLRECIWDYRVINAEEPAAIMRSNMKNSPEIDTDPQVAEIDNPSLGEMISKLDTDATFMCVKLMKDSFRPAMEHSKLLDKIGDIFRDDNLDDDKKIEKMSNLLV